ncbi:MAG: glycosyltransferase family 4 protein [Nanoarchaeota archaeon]
MKRGKILRVCHKFLVDDDGYDLDIRDLCESTSKEYTNYVTLFLEKSKIGQYIKKNKLVRKDGILYHAGTRSYVIPIEYKARYRNYLKDLHLTENAESFENRFKEILEDVKPDIVHIHGTLAPQFLEAAKQGSKKSRVFATHHIGLINQNYHNQSVRVLFSKYLTHNLMPAYCDKIICVSSHGKRSFLSKRKIVVINPVPKEKPYRKVATGTILRKNLLHNGFTLTKKDKMFLCPARFHEQKNQLRLAKAFLKAAEKDERLKLVMAGAVRDEIYFNKVLSKIQGSSLKKKFCVLPGLSNDELRSLLRETYCVITPSINEGLGRAAMEAVQAGIPVIASKDGGYPDFVKDGKNGILVNPYSQRSIAMAIINLPELPRSDRLSHQRYIKKILKIYES